LARQIDPNGGVREYTYDANNQVLTDKDPAGRTTSFTYNKAGRIRTKSINPTETLTETVIALLTSTMSLTA
jgi:YD repeat-containing protein